MNKNIAGDIKKKRGGGYHLLLYQENEHLRNKLSNVRPVVSLKPPAAHESFQNVLKKRKQQAYYQQMSQIEEENIKIFKKLSAITAGNGTIAKKILGSFGTGSQRSASFSVSPSQKMISLNPIKNFTDDPQNKTTIQDDSQGLMGQSNNNSKSALIKEQSTGRVTFRTVSPRGVQANGMNSTSRTILQQSARDLLMKSKTSQRHNKLKAIDDANAKIFQNLSRIKSSLSRQQFSRHEEINTTLKSMLLQNNSKPDPLLLIEKQRKIGFLGFGAGFSNQRTLTPFLKGSTQSTSMYEKTTSATSMSPSGNINKQQSSSKFKTTSTTPNKVNAFEKVSLSFKQQKQQVKSNSIKAILNGPVHNISNKSASKNKQISHSNYDQHHLNDSTFLTANNPSKAPGLQTLNNSSVATYYDFTANYFQPLLDEIAESNNENQSEIMGGVTTKVQSKKNSNIQMNRDVNKTAFSSYMNTINKELRTNSNRHSIEESTMNKLLPAIIEVRPTGYSTQEKRTINDSVNLGNTGMSVSHHTTANHSNLSFDSYNQDKPHQQPKSSSRSQCKTNNSLTNKILIDSYRANSLIVKERVINKLKLTYNYPMRVAASGAGNTQQTTTHLNDVNQMSQNKQGPVERIQQQVLNQQQNGPLSQKGNQSPGHELTDKELFTLQRKMLFLQSTPYISAAFLGLGGYLLDKQVFLKARDPKRIAAYAVVGFLLGTQAVVKSSQTLSRNIDGEIINAFERRYVQQVLNQTGLGSNYLSAGDYSITNHNKKPY